MNKIYFHLISFLLLFFLLYACGTSQEQLEQLPDLSNINFKLKIHRLDKEIPHFNNYEEAYAFVKQYPDFANRYLPFPDSIQANELYRLSQSPYIDTLSAEVKAHFGEMQDIHNQLETALKVVKYYYPDFKIPQVYTLITGFANDLYVDSTMIVIGLDYFLGKNTRYSIRNHRGERLPEYMTDRYQKNYIVPSVMLLLAQQFNEKDEMDKTLLAEMIAWGKTYEFAKMTIPDVPDSVIISYTSEGIQKSFDNQDLLWAHFVEKNLFFEKSFAVLNRYTGERPFTSEIGDDCPGRIGRWVGWQIVRSYLKNNPSIDLPKLMVEKNAPSIFQKSKYRPMQ
ncbi:MAG: gliding motility lipoprotein GldB [Thermoflexibacter sp.]|nr:gliding motility lipoprotein GldB [Thermoflexibacter sp.]